MLTKTFDHVALFEEWTQTTIESINEHTDDDELKFFKELDDHVAYYLWWSGVISTEQRNALQEKVKKYSDIRDAAIDVAREADRVGCDAKKHGLNMPRCCCP